MTSSKVTLRIQDQDFLKQRGFAKLSSAITQLNEAEDINIPEQTLWKYATEQVEVNEETAEHFRKIADHFGVSVLELLKPIANNEVVRLKILEFLKAKGWELKKLIEETGINQILIEFYSKQPIYKQKLNEPKSQENLNNICNALCCKIEDLIVPVEVEELPLTKLRLEDLAQEIGLSLEDLSLLTDLPHELIDLMATQPIDTSSSMFVDDAPNFGYFMKSTFCQRFGYLFPHVCPNNRKKK